MEYPNLSGDEFKKIVNLFKTIVYLVSISVSLIVGAGLFFSYKDVSAMRESIRKDSNEIREELTSLKSCAESTIDRTRDYSFNQIKYTRDFAIQEAKNSAEQRIDEIFLSTDIELLIDRVAENKLKEKVDRLIEEEMSKAQVDVLERINKTLELSYYRDRITGCSKEYYLKLDSIYSNSSDAIERG